MKTIQTLREQLKSSLDGANDRALRLVQAVLDAEKEYDLNIAPQSLADETAEWSMITEDAAGKEYNEYAATYLNEYNAALMMA